MKDGEFEKELLNTIRRQFVQSQAGGWETISVMVESSTEALVTAVTLVSAWRGDYCIRKVVSQV